jgi:uncharacterized membrane protein YedE/YeeE
MTHLLRRARWSPYLVGAGIGVLSWITFAWMSQALGTSTSFVRVAGAVQSTWAPEHVAANPYYTKLLGTAAAPKPLFDWQLVLVIALFAGALVAARLGGEKFRETVPALWRWRFGDSKLLRFGAAFAGGALLLFGARLADGCTSGHSISGGLQLAVSSWVFTGAMFVTGIVTAFALFGREGRNHVV